MIEGLMLLTVLSAVGFIAVFVLAVNGRTLSAIPLILVLGGLWIALLYLIRYALDGV